VPEVLQGVARILARRLRQDAVLVALEPVLSIDFVGADIAPAPAYDAAAAVESRERSCYGPAPQCDACPIGAGGFTVGAPLSSECAACSRVAPVSA